MTRLLVPLLVLSVLLETQCANGARIHSTNTTRLAGMNSKMEFIRRRTSEGSRYHLPGGMSRVALLTGNQQLVAKGPVSVKVKPEPVRKGTSGLSRYRLKDVVIKTKGPAGKPMKSVPKTNSKGEKGVKGNKGDKGDKGPAGPKGESGTGMSGPTGPTGPPGPFSTGPMGPTGSAGPIGTMGPTGPPGAPGGQLKVPDCPKNSESSDSYCALTPTMTSLRCYCASKAPMATKADANTFCSNKMVGSTAMNLTTFSFPYDVALMQIGMGTILYPLGIENLWVNAIFDATRRNYFWPDGSEVGDAVVICPSSSSIVGTGDLYLTISLCADVFSAKSSNIHALCYV